VGQVGDWAGEQVENWVVGQVGDWVVAQVEGLGKQVEAQAAIQKVDPLVTWGSGPLLWMAGYSSLCELFFIISKFYFDRVDPLEPNFLVLDNIDIE